MSTAQLYHRGPAWPQGFIPSEPEHLIQLITHWCPRRTDWASGTRCISCMVWMKTCSHTGASQKHLWDNHQLYWGHQRHIHARVCSLIWAGEIRSQQMLRSNLSRLCTLSLKAIHQRDLWDNGDTRTCAGMKKCHHTMISEEGIWFLIYTCHNLAGTQIHRGRTGPLW